MAEKLVERPVVYKRQQNGTLVQEFDDSRVKNYWRRHKKATVDLLELPVAVDRQLEDQRVTMEYNRNPRLHIPTKVDKVRSEQIIAKKGNSRDVGIKAKVLNKVVREASGQHGYVIVPPARMKGEEVEMDADPETNPFVALYAKETKKKPVIVSFGHRPRSASRVFNPGTMKIKMKHNEVAKAPNDPNKFQFGLPVGILGKILKAPHIKAVGSMLDDDEEDVSQAGTLGSSFEADPHDLFSLPPDSPDSHARGGGGRPFGGQQQQPSGRSMQKGFADESLTQQGSWVSTGSGSGSQSKPSKKSKKTSIFTEKLSPVKDAVDPIDRPAWDTAHNVIAPQTRMKEVYALKANHINANKYTMKERLTRFNAKTIADEMTPYCTDKQQNDFHLLRSESKPTDVQKSSAFYNHGVTASCDPLNGQLIQVKKNYRELLEDKEEMYKAQDFQRSIQEIPKVAYHPKTLLTQMQQGQVTLKQIGRLARSKPQLWEQRDFTTSPDKDDDGSVGSGVYSAASPSVNTHTTGGSSHYYAGGPSLKYDVTGDLLPEAKTYSAMKKAKKGNRTALFNLFMQENMEQQQQQQGEDEAGYEYELGHIPGDTEASVGSNFGTVIQTTDDPTGAMGGHHQPGNHNSAAAALLLEQPGSRPFSGLDHEIEGGQFFEDAGSFESLPVEGDAAAVVAAGAAAGNIDAEDTRAETTSHRSKLAAAEEADAEAETEVEAKPEPRHPQLQITIVSATGLAPANMFGGLSDPYVSIWDDATGVSKKDEIWRTKCISDTLEPQWGDPAGSGESFVFPIEELRPKSAPGVEYHGHDRSKFKSYRLEVYDYNKLTRGVFLGCVFLKPEHYHCEDDNGGGAGEREETYEWDLGAHEGKTDKENKLAKGKLTFKIKFVYK